MAARAVPRWPGARLSRVLLAAALAVACPLAFVGPTNVEAARSKRLHAVPELLSLAETGDEKLAAEAVSRAVESSQL